LIGHKFPLNILITSFDPDVPVQFTKSPAAKDLILHFSQWPWHQPLLAPERNSIPKGREPSGPNGTMFTVIKRALPSVFIGNGEFVNDGASDCRRQYK
jgi:hypothetical protein